MELSYWESRWRKGNTGFHMDGGYPGLEKYWEQLNVPVDATVLVPLCGKTKDLIYLSSRVKKVAGVEISKIAVDEFFEENNLSPAVSTFADFQIYTAGNIELWRGDFMKLPEQKFRDCSLIYDKSALVALPSPMRKTYTKKVIRMCQPDTRILLHHFVYEQPEMTGPPFSVEREEIERLYSGGFRLLELEKNSLEINQFQKFAKRGLKSYLIEYLLLLLPDEKK